MTKKHFIALANTIRESTGTTGESTVFNKRQILYIAGKCGPNGGAR